ncbi:viral A-type inclusion protein [Enterococcus olivae]
MSEELEQEKLHEETSNLAIDFDEIKEVASKNITSMLKDLQDFEDAIEMENIPEIYRIYKGRLHKELKQTSNQNHEIDDLLSRKLHDNFVARFPFMEHVEKISPTIHHYKIGSYYRERPTIGFDASIPEIFVLPYIDKEWQYYHPDNREILENIEQEIDQLDAKFIAAKTELETISRQLKEVENQKTAIQNNKGFFNRGKADEEMEELERREKLLQEKKQTWLPFVESKESTNRKKDELMQRYEETRLKRAVVTKEYRLIDRYFGGATQMSEQIQDFLNGYLYPTKGETADE